METRKEIANQLNKLLEKNNDAQKGYQNAAENVENPQMRSFFEQQAQQREQWAGQLRQEIQNLGQEAKDEGSATGALHRTWMDLKSQFSSNDEKRMMEEVERGEKAAIAEYDEVIGNHEIPATTRQALERQRSVIQSCCHDAKQFQS